MSEKKKVGIVTLHGYFNYGNRLQNYAVEQILKSLGCEVESIVNTTRISNENKNSNKSNIFNKFPKIFNMSFKKTLYKVYNKFWYYNNKNLIKKIKKEKENKFVKFSENFLNESNNTISINDIPSDLGERYDYFIAGSDQVWNPLFNDTSHINFLTFAPYKKRISFSASFGIPEIPKKYVNDYKKWLNEMNSISVREFEGAKIIKELTGRDSKVLVDPTMLLDKKEWLDLSKESPNKPNSKYLFIYILGNISLERKKLIKNIARNNNLEIVNLTDMKQLDTYSSGPREFIDFINSASLVLTDSFHASIFSVIFRTPFVVFNRDYNNMSMNSRINTLFKKLKLESRFDENLDFEKDLFNINFNITDDILKQEKLKAINFLKNSLDIKSD